MTSIANGETLAVVRVAPLSNYARATYGRTAQSLVRAFCVSRRWFTFAQLAGSDESISHAVDGEQVGGVRGIGLQLAPEVLHMGVDAAVVPVILDVVQAFEGTIIRAPKFPLHEDREMWRVYEELCAWRETRPQV